MSSTSVEPLGQVNCVPDSPAWPPRTRMVMLITSSRMTSNAYSATVTRTPNLRPITTGDHEHAVGNRDDLGQPPDMGIAESFCTI